MESICFNITAVAEEVQIEIKEEVLTEKVLIENEKVLIEKVEVHNTSVKLLI